MLDAPLTLYVDAFFISPYALSAFVALEEKGLPYSLVEVALHEKQHQQPGYGARTGRVPSLKHGDFVLAESSAIAEYLAETFAYPKYPRLFPENLQQRAVARELMAWVRSDLMPIREERSTYTVFYEPAKAPLSAKGEAAKKRLFDAVTPLIHGPTLFDAWCLADTDLAMMLKRLAHDGLPPTLKAYVDANWARPSVQKWVSRNRPPYQSY